MSARNQTITLTDDELKRYENRLLRLTAACTLDDIRDRTIHQDLFEVLPLLPPSSVDLLLVDPPYNLSKRYNNTSFKAMPAEQYREFTESWLVPVLAALKPTASIYICGDWRNSSQIAEIGRTHLVLQNRITWEREKGRGAKKNWKNACEDIWFFTRSDDYTFDLEAVKLKRRVIAPYRNNGKPKDWDETAAGNFRLTHPSNIWTDLTVPFWSMPENTEHPTQKPEKLVARIILASCPPGGVVLDPFLGSGTTSVVAKKLGRSFIGVERELEYCCLAEKRLAAVDEKPQIQGIHNGVFYERNSRPNTGDR